MRSPLRGGQKRPVSIIGAGRVGTALAIALDRTGHSLNLIVARLGVNAERASKLAGGQGTSLSARQFRQMLTSENPLFPPNSLIIIATPDDVIPSVARELAGSMNLQRGLIALHTSGALTSHVLHPLRVRGISVGALHPLVSISDPVIGARSLSQAHFCVEGDAAASRAAKSIVRKIGGRVFTIRAELKPLYHAAALMASPNFTALIDIALEMLSRCGLSANQARNVLLPLIKSTTDNLAIADPAHALTGTFKRGDVVTIKKHVEAISSQKLFDALEAYVLLGRHSLKLARPSRHTRAEIDQILNEALKRARARR